MMESKRIREAAAKALQGAALPPVAARDAFEADLNRLRAREKEHTHQGDAIAAQRRRLPMVEVDPADSQIVDPPSTPFRFRLFGFLPV